MSRAAFEREILAIVRERLLFGSHRRLPMSATLAELGLDSLATLELITALEEAFEVDLTDELAAASGSLSLGRLARMVAVVAQARQPGVSQADES